MNFDALNNTTTTPTPTIKFIDAVMVTSIVLDGFGLKNYLSQANTLVEANFHTEVNSFFGNYRSYPKEISLFKFRQFLRGLIQEINK